MSEFNSTLGPKINNTDREAREAREREREAREARHTRTYKPMQKTKTKTKKKKKKKKKKSCSAMLGTVERPVHLHALAVLQRNVNLSPTMQ